MKTKTTFILLYLFSIVVSAQSVDLDREYIKTKYINLPQTPIIDETKRTFSFTSNDNITNDKIKLHGFERINSNGAISGSLTYSPITITKVEIKEHVKEKKDKEGNVTSRTKTYQPIINYTTDGYFSYTNNISTKDRSWNLGDKQQYEAEKYTKKKDALQYMELNANVLKEKLQKEFITSSISFVNKFLNNNFGYAPTSNKELFWILDSKSNPEYDGHKKALQNIKNVLAKIKTDSNVSLLENEIQDIVTYFESVIPKYQKDKKKHRKMKYASYYNSAKLFYLIDMPDKAIAYAEKLIENDYDKKNGERIIKNCNNLKESFSINNTNTRHFKVDSEDNRSAPEEIQPEIIVIEKEVIKEKPPVTDLLLSGNTEIDNVISKNLLNEIELIISIENKKLYPFKDRFLKKNNKIFAKIIQQSVGDKRYDTINLVHFKDKIMGARYNDRDITLTFDDKKLFKRMKSKTYGMDYKVWRNNASKIIKTVNYYNNGASSNTSINYKNNKLVSFEVDMKRRSDDKVLVSVIEDTEKKHHYSTKNFNKKHDQNTVFIEHILESPLIVIINRKSTTKKHPDKPSIGTKKYYYTDFGKLKKAEEKLHYFIDKGKRESKSEKIVANFYEKQKKTKFIHISKNITNPEYSFKRIINYKDLIKKPNIKEFEWRKGSYNFDQNNDLIFISRDGKYKKKENGVWTNWRYMKY